MSYRILHVLGFDKSIRLENNRVYISDQNSEDWVPIEDISFLIAATPRVTLVGNITSKLAEYDVPVVFIDNKFRPQSILIPYHRTTRTETIRAQVDLSDSFNTEATKCILRAKVEGQGNFINGGTKFDSLSDQVWQSDDPVSVEANAAQIYWDRLIEQFPTEESQRLPGTSRGANKLLNYGYAMATSAVHRSIAGHGLIASLGFQHRSREHSAPLAYDLVEPLRPFIDQVVLNIVTEHKGIPDKSTWVEALSNRFEQTVFYDGKDRRLLSSIDRYVRSVAKSVREKNPELISPLLFKSDG